MKEKSFALYTGDNPRLISANAATALALSEAFGKAELRVNAVGGLGLAIFFGSDDFDNTRPYIYLQRSGSTATSAYRMNLRSTGSTGKTLAHQSVPASDFPVLHWLDFGDILLLRISDCYSIMLDIRNRVFMGICDDGVFMGMHQPSGTIAFFTPKAPIPSEDASLAPLVIPDILGYGAEENPTVFLAVYLPEFTAPQQFRMGARAVTASGNPVAGGQFAVGGIA